MTNLLKTTRTNCSIANTAPKIMLPAPKPFALTQTPEFKRANHNIIMARDIARMLNNTRSITTNTSVDYRSTSSVRNGYLNLHDLKTNDSFINKMTGVKLSLDQRYTVFIKVRYNVDMFFSAGSQFGFHYNDKTSLTELYYTINAKLDEYQDKYNLTDDNIIYIQVILRPLDKHVYNKLKFVESDNISSTDSNKLISITSIPFRKTVEEFKQLGYTLPVYLDSNNYITNIELNINGMTINFWDKIVEKASLIAKNKSNSITNVDCNYSFIYIKSKTDYVLAVKQLNYNSIEILKYSLSGVLISKSVDNFSDTFTKRTKGTENIFVNNDNEVIKSESMFTLTKIKKIYIKV